MEQSRTNPKDGTNNQFNNTSNNQFTNTSNTPIGQTAAYDGAGTMNDSLKDAMKAEQIGANMTKEATMKENYSTPPSQRGDLASAEQVGEKLMSEFDTQSGALKAAVQEAMRQQTLSERAQRINMASDPVNEWPDSSPLSHAYTRKIVNKIPHVIKLVRSQNNTLDKEVLTHLIGQYGTGIDAVVDSCSMFSSNTDEVTYIIDTFEAGTQITYNPESPPATTLKIKAFHVSADDNKSMEDAESRTNAFSSLLELVLKLRKAGDVYIQSPEMKAIAELGITNEPIALFSGKNVPTGMLPHILVGTYAHTLPWFRTQVSNLIGMDEVLIGEYDGVVKCADSDCKLRSNYAVFTDSIFATLHHIHMEKHFAKKGNAAQFAESVRSIAPEGSTIKVIGDTEIDMWETYQPDEQDAEKYIFTFLLAPSIRRAQYRYLEIFITNMRGIREITASDRLRTEAATVDPMNVKTTVEDALIKRIRGYHLQHFIQMMVMERAHAFIEPIAFPESTFTAMQDAVTMLLAVAIDALVFPNLFWTNIHIYSLSIYNAWKFLHIVEYERMIENGYTPNNARPKQLTKQEIRSGEIPRIFTTNPQRLPRLIGRYINALAPVGYQFQLNVAQQRWSPILNENPSFYIPFEYFQRPKIGTVPDTPFTDRFYSIAQVVKELISVWRRNNNQSANVTSAMTSTITTLTEMARTFGSICHYELNILYRAMANGPEIIYTTYTGVAEANQAPYVGLASTVIRPQVGLASMDRTEKLHLGIGLWALMSLMGDQLTTSGHYSNASPSGFQFPDPRNRLIRYFDMIQQCSPVSDAFGLMSYMLDTDGMIDSPWRFLVNVFGSSLKAGVATQVMEWLIPGVNLKEFIFGKGASTSGEIYADTRLRRPRFAELGYSGAVLNPRPGISPFLNRPLDLIDQFELRKLEVAIDVVANENSCLHNYSQTLVVAKTPFQYFSPYNRHPEADIDIDFSTDDDLFGYMIYGNETRIFFTVNGRRWIGIWEPGFPENVRVRILNPAEVLVDQWAFLEVAVDTRGWQLEFTGINFLTKVARMTNDVAAAYVKTMSWHFLKEARFGTVVPVTFLDTRGDLPNNRTTVFPAGCTQFICAVAPIQRNVAVRSIVGLQPTPAWVPPNPDMWTIGNLNSEDIPRHVTGLAKYKDNLPNFNNFLMIWTGNAKLIDAPPTIFLPPIGESL